MKNTAFGETGARQAVHVIGSLGAIGGKAEAGCRTLLPWADKLIERHTRYATPDLAQAQSHLSSLNECISLIVQRPQDFVGYKEVLLTLGDIVLTMGCVDARRGYELNFQSGDEYLVTIPLRGAGWASTGGMTAEYGRGDIMIVTPLCGVTKHWDGPGQVLSLHIPATRLHAAPGGLRSAARPSAPIVKIGSQRLRCFMRVIDMVCEELQGGARASPLMRMPFVNQIEDLLLSLLLEELSEAGGSLMEPAPQASLAVPYYVRRAEQFIAGNAHRDINANDMAAAANVSLRTIQYGFRRFRDTTPMLHLKRQRYERARTILLAGLRGRKISDVATEIGHAKSISQFSRDYRSFFGEAPSQTIAASRRLV